MTNNEIIILSLLEKYPDKVPVCVIDKTNDKDETKTKKYLIPKKFTVNEFMLLLRNKFSLNPKEGVFLMIGDILAPSNKTIIELYKEYNKDHILNVTIIKENTFGNIKIKMNNIFDKKQL